MKKTLPILISFSLLTGMFFISDGLAAQDVRVTVKEVVPFAYVCVPAKGPYTEIGNVIGQLMQALQSQNIVPTGPMIGVFYNSPQDTQPAALIWEMGFPVTYVTAQPPLVFKTWDFTTVAEAIHTGPYEKAEETYEKIFEWLTVNGYEPAGPVMEKYLNDPSIEKPENLQSEIWIPCKKIGD